VAYTKKVLEEDIKRAHDLKDKQEEARMNFDIQQAKLNKEVSNVRVASSSDVKQLSPKAEELDQAFNQAQSGYNDINDKLVACLNDFDQVSQEFRWLKRNKEFLIS
jgi:hypothetical protein